MQLSCFSGCRLQEGIKLHSMLKILYIVLSNKKTGIELEEEEEEMLYNYDNYVIKD